MSEVMKNCALNLQETGRGLVCEDCLKNPELWTSANGAHLGRRFPEIDALIDVEAMLLARVHPLISVFTVQPSGQHAYRGHVCNLEQHSVQWLTSLPASGPVTEKFCSAVWYTSAIARRVGVSRSGGA